MTGKCAAMALILTLLMIMPAVPAGAIEEVTREDLQAALLSRMPSVY